MIFKVISSWTLSTNRKKCNIGILPQISSVNCYWAQFQISCSTTYSLLFFSEKTQNFTKGLNKIKNEEM